jgi:hypothetical protein
MDVRKIVKYQISQKNRPVGAELLHANGWTDVRTDGQTETDRERQRQKDRQDEANIRFSPLCERAYFFR